MSCNAIVDVGVISYNIIQYMVCMYVCMYCMYVRPNIGRYIYVIPYPTSHQGERNGKRTNIEEQNELGRYM